MLDGKRHFGLFFADLPKSLLLAPSAPSAPLPAVTQGSAPRDHWAGLLIVPTRDLFAGAFGLGSAMVGGSFSVWVVG